MILQTSFFFIFLWLQIYVFQLQNWACERVEFSAEIYYEQWDLNLYVLRWTAPDEMLATCTIKILPVDVYSNRMFL